MGQIHISAAEAFHNGTVRKLYQAGVEQGIEQGIEQTKKKMACSLLKDNIPLEKVAKLLEVKVSDIEKWKPDMK